MKLKLAEKWIDETFEEDSKPSVSDVRQWVINDNLPGRILGELTYVDADRFAYSDGPIYKEQSEQLSAMSLLEG